MHKEKTKETIVITGGAGFIGSHVVDRYIREGYRVVVIDWSERKKTYVPKEAIWYRMSFDDVRIRDIFADEQPTTVIHLAAQISVTRSVSHPVEDAENNIIRSIVLLETAKEFGVKTFLFASSGGAVYGEQEEMPIALLDQVAPPTPYGIGKYIFDEYALAAATDDFHVGILRFSNVYGPHQVSEGEAGVISIFLEQIFEGKTCEIYGDGTATRDYVYVKDVVEAFVLAKQAEKTFIANISTGVETSILDLVKVLQMVSDGKMKVIHKEKRLGDIQRSCMDPRSAKELLGWEPKIDLAKGLQETYTWFKDDYAAN